MEKSNEMPTRVALVCTGAIGLAAISGCSSEPVDYEGVNDTFEVRGIVDDVDSDGEIYIDKDNLLHGPLSGRAINWFMKEEGVQFLSDDFNFKQYYGVPSQGWAWSCYDAVPVGHIYDKNNKEITPEELPEGAEVTITGRVHNDKRPSGKTCTDTPQAIYQEVHIVHTPLDR